MRIQQITAFQINPECKISALATIMHTKKEDRTTTNDNQNVECRIMGWGCIVGFRSFSARFPYICSQSG